MAKSLDFKYASRLIIPLFRTTQRVSEHRSEGTFFMLEAFFANRTVSVLVEALPRILTAGLTMTIPLTLVSFFFAMIIAVAVALVQYANVPVLRQIARFYILSLIHI